MQIAKETITPKKAMEWLKRNVNNRPMRKGYAERLAEAIDAGEFMLNGETIKFNGNGDLVDGQHRLNAIIIAGKPIECYVVRGVQHDAFDTIDTGTPRQTRDTFARMGKLHYSHLATAVGVVHAILTGRNDGKVALRNAQAVKVLEQHPNIEASVSMMSTNMMSRLMSLGNAAGLHYLMSVKDKALADQFWQSVSSGENLTKSMPAHAFRERLISNRSSKGKLHRRDINKLAIKAWNLARAGKTVKCLKIDEDEELQPIQ